MKRILIGAVLPWILISGSEPLGWNPAVHGAPADDSVWMSEVVEPSAQSAPELTLSTEPAVNALPAQTQAQNDEPQTDTLTVTPSEPEDATPEITYYDVPLTKEQQEFATALAEQYGINVKIAYGVMYTESRFTEKAIGSGCYGIMQIARSNHKRLKKLLGISDFLKYEDNVTAGIYLLGTLRELYGSDHMALMAYNMGGGTAGKYFRKGIYKTNYSCKVVKYAKSLKEVSAEELPVKTK